MASAADSDFVGRTTERAALTSAVLRKDRGLVVLRGGPGSGKSMLVNHWLRDLLPLDHGLEKIFAGSAGRSGNAPTPEALLARLLAFLAPDDDPKAAPAVDRLLQALRRHRALVVLDGIDAFRSLDSRTSDRSHAALSQLWLWLQECVRTGNSCVVLTTRVPLPEIEARTPLTALAVRNLSDDDGAELLHRLGVRGRRRTSRGRDDPDLRAAARDVGGHPLALSLLGKYLVQAHGGDVRARPELPVRPGPGCVAELVSAFERWFERGPELAILRILGATDGLVTREQLARLARHRALARVSNGLASLSDDGWEWALKILQECGLVRLRDDARINVPRLIHDRLRQSLRLRVARPA